MPDQGERACLVLLYVLLPYISLDFMRVASHSVNSACVRRKCRKGKAIALVDKDIYLMGRSTGIEDVTCSSRISKHPRGPCMRFLIVIPYY